MKNRKKMLVIFLVCAALIVSVGYATVTNVLDIQGSATVDIKHSSDAFNADIYFTGVKNAEGNFVSTIEAAAGLDYTANINTNNNDKAQFTVTGLEEKDDSTTITYQIKNDSDYEATVALKTLTNTNLTDFTFDYYFGSDTSAESATIAAHGTVEVSVVVKVARQLTDYASGSFIIELSVTADAPDAETIVLPETETPVEPT